jgi:hypothetical protein
MVMVLIRRSTCRAHLLYLFSLYTSVLILIHSLASSPPTLIRRIARSLTTAPSMPHSRMHAACHMELIVAQPAHRCSILPSLSPLCVTSMPPCAPQRPHSCSPTEDDDNCDGSNKIGSLFSRSEPSFFSGFERSFYSSYRSEPSSSYKSKGCGDG